MRKDKLDAERQSRSGSQTLKLVVSAGPEIQMGAVELTALVLDWRRQNRWRGPATELVASILVFQATDMYPRTHSSYLGRITCALIRA